MSSPWDKIGDINPDLANPIDVIAGLFDPIYSKTSGRVRYRAQKVSFFPEEVTYTTTGYLELGGPVKKVDPHPEYGYNPNDVARKQDFRYRLLLCSDRDADIEYELFRIKYPLMFYPVEFYIEKRAFPEIAKYFSKSQLTVSEESSLKEIVSQIITADATIKIIKRLMAIQRG